ncbi:Ssk2-type MAP kinase [Venturia nashicola]|nr:Ssk2-type MAP kinase [Venturia nashicola]
MAEPAAPRGVRFTESEASVSMPTRPENRTQESSSSSGSEPGQKQHNSDDDDNEGQFHFTPAVVTTPLDDVPAMAASGSYAWNAPGQVRGRGGSLGASSMLETSTAANNNGASSSSRPARPNAVRTPSNAYAPSSARRPAQHSINSTSSRHRNNSANRKRNPNADYRAQEKAYVQRIRQDAPDPDDFIDADLRTPSLDFSSDSGSDGESPSTADYIDDPYDQEITLYYGNEDMQPSVEELKVPENRERLEWHSMLASVLTGDVVKQEKKRLIGGSDQHADDALKAEVWMGIRARCCGRLLQAQRRMVEEGRAKAKSTIESIITFEIKGEAEVGQNPAQQVEHVVKKIEKCEALYMTRQAMEAAHPRAASAGYTEACDAVISWYNTTQLINTELQILRNWVGNDELDFSKPRLQDESDRLSDDSSFIERILKEDGLKSLQGKDSLLVSLNKFINKAKMTLIANAQAFAERHLPPYIEELQTLINFPSRLVQEIIRVRLSYAKKTKNPAEQGLMMTEQMIVQFQILLNLAAGISRGAISRLQSNSSLTSKSLLRLSSQFEKELARRPDEVAGAEMDKRYKAILDSVRIRQRKLFRFSRILTQRFENCAEYSINLEREQLMEFYDTLIFSGHFLIETTQHSIDGVYILACPALQDRPKDVQSLLGSCYHAEDRPEDLSNPYLLILRPEHPLPWVGPKVEFNIRQPQFEVQVNRMRLVADGSQQRLADAKIAFGQATQTELTVLNDQRANLPRVNAELKKIKRTAFKLSNTIMESVEIIRTQTAGLDCQELIQTCFAFATEFGQRSLMYMDANRRALNNTKLMKLALDWVSFICDDCVPSDRKTFRWAVVALEFAMMMTRGQNILSISEEEYSKLRAKVAGCMSLLISHFDIMGARSTMAAQAEKQRMDAMLGKNRLDVSRLRDDEESSYAVQCQWVEQLAELDRLRIQRESERQALGRVLEDTNEADRALTYLSSSATNVTLRWQQGQFVGGGTFGSVYAAINLDSGQMMAVKEIRLQDPQLIPTIVAQIRDEMGVLQVLDHPNIVQYYGIEPHRDKVYIFMEFCDGGSLAGLLEHGRVEDETVIMVYSLQMLEGLAYLHERNVVHRDIKPENILLDHDGLIKFVDFGAAKVIARQGKTLAAEHNATRQGRQNSMQGTPMYMSPEVIRGHASGRLGAVDIWSLGCVILEMATGRRPWASLDNEWAIMYNIAQGNPPQLPTRDQLSDQGIDFLKRCFEKDPVKRASAAELLQHDWIGIIRSQLDIEPPPQTPSSESGSNGSWTNSRQNSTSSQ